MWRPVVITRCCILSQVRQYSVASGGDGREIGERKRETTFGFETVTEEIKAEKVQAVFSNVAKSYDIMNDVMSLGLHRFWKDLFVDRLAPPPGTRVLDVAGGTGDIAFRIANYNDKRGGVKVVDAPPSEITVLDINPEMLEEGAKKPGSEKISWIHGDALALPFPDNSFDAYTIAFGIRNIANFEQALSEAIRVLVPGGRFLCMEFSDVKNPLLKRLYDTYSFQLIPVFGDLIAQDRDAYQYLVESIRQFPDQELFKSMIQTAGFCHATYESLIGGVVAIHSGFKPIKR